MPTDRQYGGVLIFILVVFLVFFMLIRLGADIIQAWFSGITTGLIILTLLGFGVAYKLIKARE